MTVRLLRRCPNDEVDRAFVVLQCAHRRGIAVRQVVERPAVTKQVVIEEIVIPDDAAFDARDSAVANLRAIALNAPGTSLRSLMLGSPPPMTMRSPRRTPSSIGASDATFVSNR